jgi:methionyl-tRNA formyltransferase
MKIDILNDNPSSWIVNYIPQLVVELRQFGHDVESYVNKDELNGGDILCALSCEKILKRDVLSKYRSTIVAHPSNLPEGKGWSPLAWQILEGKNNIVISLIEASNKVDSGPIYLQGEIKLSGHELNDEIKKIQFEETKLLVIDYVKSFPIKGRNQEGQESFYPKFKRTDNRLDINKTIFEQFNILRIVDNDAYPAYFELNGFTYELKISKI